MRPQFLKDRKKDNTVFDWAGRFYEAAAQSHAMARKEDGTLWTMPAAHHPRPVFSLDEFLGQVPNIVDVVTEHRSKAAKPDDPPEIVQTTLDIPEARVLFHSEQRTLLPVLRAVIFEPVVLVDGEHRRVSKPGFDASTGILYWLPPGRKAIEPREGTHHLKTCFSGVPFEREEYRNNLLAFLLGYVIFDNMLETPILVVSGNTQGIGKSKTVEACGYILLGQTPAPVSYKPEEFSKQVGTRFLEGSRFINIDNVTAEGHGGTYKNSILSQLVTQSFSKRVRALGHNRSIEASGVAFAMSANNCRLEADLASRALPIKLHAERSKPMNPYVLGYAMENRDEIYGELLWLALQESPILIDNSVAPNCRFRSWVRATFGRIQSHFGPLFIEGASEFSDAELDLYSWGYDQHCAAVARGEPGFVFTGFDLKQQIEASENIYFGLRERFTSKSSVIRTQAINGFLRANESIWFHLNKLVRIQLVCLGAPSDGHAKKWTFAVETENEQPE